MLYLRGTIYKLTEYCKPNSIGLNLSFIKTFAVHVVVNDNQKFEFGEYLWNNIFLNK